MQDSGSEVAICALMDPRNFPPMDARALIVARVWMHGINGQNLKTTVKNDEERNEIRSQERTSVAIMSNDEKRNEICHRERISLAMGNEMPALCYVLHQWKTESSLGHFAPLYWVKFGGHSLSGSMN